MVRVEEREDQRRLELEGLGIHTRAALHLAPAESGSVNVFLTTDDRLMPAAPIRFSSSMPAMNPAHGLKGTGIWKPRHGHRSKSGPPE